MRREIIRVEPLSAYLERWKAPTSAVTRHGEALTASKLTIFDVRPRGGSSHPPFSSRPSGSALPELQKSRRFLTEPVVIRGMSVNASSQQV
jgi:hypothetical protein